MKRSTQIALGLLVSCLLVSSGLAADLTVGMTAGKPAFKSAGPLAFGPDGILFVADAQSAAIIAIDTQDTKPGAAGKLLKVEGINAKVAALLGTAADQVIINDMAINPISRNAYLAVSRGRGPEAVGVLSGLIGMSAELLLMDHFEDVWMMIPLALIGFSLVVLIVHAFRRSRATVRVFQLSMLLMIVGGALGTFLHHRAKEEFQLEGQPSLSGMKLFWQAMRGTTPPSLAPAALIQTGLLGLAWAYRHPACNRSKPNSSTPTGDLT